MRANFSIAMGALIAGVTLSAFPYSLDVVAKIRSLRDFFVTLFFVVLGMQLQIDSLKIVTVAVALSAVVIATRFLIVMPVLHQMRYGVRVATLCSIALAQAGEFGLVIVSLGLTLGHIGRDVASIIALTLVITATLSTYMVMGNHAIAHQVVGVLRRLGIQDRPLPGLEQDPTHVEEDVLLLGFHRVASSLLYESQNSIQGHEILIVDFSPEVHRQLRALEVPVIYGDISHLDTLEHAGLHAAKVVVSTVSEDFLRSTNNMTMLRQVRRLNPEARVILSAETFERARAMYEAGADYVVMPRVETAKAFLEVLDAIERGELDDLRARALADLADRKEVLA
jgi:voltage-gated potassium channel Kch